MRTAVLILAWITPALIAGALGWSGIWGAGSALVEYLIPMPVAGGVLHVPSFAVLIVLVLSSRDWAGPRRSLLPLIAGLLPAIATIAAFLISVMKGEGLTDELVAERQRLHTSTAEDPVLARHQHVGQGPVLDQQATLVLGDDDVLEHLHHSSSLRHGLRGS